MEITSYPDLRWALEKNGYMKINLFNQYRNNDEYLTLIDNLISNLKNNGIKNIQDKFTGSSEIDDFHASISELEIAKKFLDNGFDIHLYSDKQTDTSNPDFNAIDTNFEYDVEVTRILEHVALDNMLNYFTYMTHSNDFFIINLHLSAKLTKLLLSPRYKNNKNKIKKLIGESINQVEKDIKNIENNNDHNIITKIGEFIFRKHNISNRKFNLFTIGWSVSEKPMEESIKHRILEKSKKRTQQSANSETFLIFIILEHQLMPRKVVKSTLESLLCNNMNGLFYSGKIDNVGAVIGKRYDEYYVFPNSRFKKTHDVSPIKENLSFLELKNQTLPHPP